MNGKHRFSEYFYNRITMSGVILAILTLIVEFVLWVTEISLGIESPYFGMVTWLILPPFLVIGVLLIPAGAWWTRRRLLKNPEATVFKTLHVDFSNPTHRRTVLALTTGGILFLVLSSAGLYHTYHYTESVSFCGEVCHKVMNPEFTAYQTSAHAHVKCASCHIGAGASYFAKSKLTGSYQIYSVLMEKYPKPIPTPVKNLRPAQETCEQCHWPQQFYSPKERTYSHFLSDEKNTPAPVRLMVNVGGGKPGRGQTGIHLHMNINHVIEYIASDTARQTIAWVRSTNRTTGEVHEYKSTEHPLSDTDATTAGVRRMDCLDCHNRPAHKFPSPQTAVNDALEAGGIDRSIPFVKREAVRAIDMPYQTAQEAMAGIAG
ncbi:NapC/NirT family cytochrome c, partial [bacterium]|nr:NapC/NirT family cytochrome c [bacterium]